MSEKRVILAVEDMLGETVCRRIIESLGLTVVQLIGLKGKGYLQVRAPSLNQASKGFMVLMLTDLDTVSTCAPQLIRSWIKGRKNPRFFLRVAVMEVESWILADRRGVADFLSIPLARIPDRTDHIPRPKEFLVSLGRLSRNRELRRQIVPAVGSTSTVGPGYNSCIATFVRDKWDIKPAVAVSSSLNRTLARLRDIMEGNTSLTRC